MSAPNKEERQKCWQARDAYFECLDKYDDDGTKCKTQRNVFEKNCIAQWVSFTVDKYSTDLGISDGLKPLTQATDTVAINLTPDSGARLITFDVKFLPASVSGVENLLVA